MLALIGAFEGKKPVCGFSSGVSNVDELVQVTVEPLTEHDPCALAATAHISDTPPAKAQIHWKLRTKPFFAWRVEAADRDNLGRDNQGLRDMLTSYSVNDSPS